MQPRISIITLGVQDMRRAIGFYRHGLGFPTTAADDARWAIFRTCGTRLALFPKDELARDIDPATTGSSPGAGGITLAHNTDTREEVDEVLARAQRAGARIVKPARPASWGGYSGYFLDLDGYAWEVAWAEAFVHDEHGILWGGSIGRP